LEKEWNALFAKYAESHPDLAAEFKRRFAGELPEGWDKDLPTNNFEGPGLATRQTSQAVLLKLADRLPELFGGSADLNPSCLTYLKSSRDFQKATPDGRNVRYGVREHAMAAISNGLAAYGGFIPFCSTFLNFIGYAWGAVILGSLTGSQTLYIMTHDSIGVGEDGPTHQPIEKYLMCRSIPHLLFFRPCDANETAGAYVAAIKHRHGPSVLSLSRQAVPPQRGTSIEGTLKGAYTIHDSEGTPELILVGTGTEVSLCTEAAAKLAPRKVRVVSFPSWELFDAQTQEYKESVFIPGVPVLSVEAGVTMGWSKYAHAQIGIDTFGFSGPAKDVYTKVGVSVGNIIEKSNKLLDFYGKHPVPSLVADPFA